MKKEQEKVEMFLCSAEKEHFCAATGITETHVASQSETQLQLQEQKPLQISQKLFGKLVLILFFIL